MKKQKGFSLIELLIVVAIILIIAAIAIPNLMRARMSANEASAVGSLRTINTAEVQYNTSYGIGFTTIAKLGGSAATCATATGATSANACLIDATLAGATAGVPKSGYTFLITPANANATYVSQGIPAAIGQTGQRAFCSDQSGVIQYNTTGAVTATCTETPLQ